MPFKDQTVMTLFMRVWANAMQSGLPTFLLIFPSLIFIPAGYYLAEAVSSPILCVLETFALLRILHYCLFDFGRGMVRVQISFYL